MRKTATLHVNLDVDNNAIMRTLAATLEGVDTGRQGKVALDYLNALYRLNAARDNLYTATARLESHGLARDK